MKVTVDREWFERRVRLEEGLDVAAGLPYSEALSDSAGIRVASQGEDDSGCAGTQAAFGKLINMRRRECNLTLQALAERADVDPRELRRIESSGDSVEAVEPDPRTVYNLAEALELPSARLLELSGLVIPEDEELCEEAVRFAARALPEGLSEEERGVLNAFVQYLAQKP